MRKLLLLAAMAASLNVFGQWLSPGEIYAFRTNDCELKVWTTVLPYQANLQAARIEYTCWTGSGYKTRTLGYVPPNNTDTLTFQVPESGAIKVRKYVTWKWPAQGNFQSWSPYVDLPECAGNVQAAVPKITILNQNLHIETPWPGAFFMFDAMGNQVGFKEFDFSCDFVLNDFVSAPGQLFYLNVLLYDPQGLRSETFTVWF